MEQGPYLRSPERSLALSVVVEAALNFRGLEALLWQGLWVLSPGSVSGKLNVFLYSSLPNKRSAIFINFCQNLMRYFYFTCATFIYFQNFECATFIRFRYICFTA